MGDQSPPLQRARLILTLIIAGEAVYGLPFLVARVFRPTLLDVLQITNLQLGTAFSLYGIVAMMAYFPGGPLADRFSPRWLLSIALATTSLGGIYYASVPSVMGLPILFGFWGLSTILLFWAALIRATREWGGSKSQGAGFGILEGGRGLFAALLASVTVAVFDALLPAEVESTSLEERGAALQTVIFIFTGMTALVSVLVWLWVPNKPEPSPDVPIRHAVTLESVMSVLKKPTVWLQGLVVLCAYTGFKGADDLGLFSRDAFGFDDVESARLSTVSLWVRPFAALGAGLLADRIGDARCVAICFSIVLIGDVVFALGVLPPSAGSLLIMNVVWISAGVFGLRGVYFALFEDGQVPVTLTGTAVGVVSVIGYTPDIFMGPLMGYLTDNYPGSLGHKYLFAVLAGFAAIGLATTLAFQRLTPAVSDHEAD